MPRQRRGQQALRSEWVWLLTLLALLALLVKTKFPTHLSTYRPLSCVQHDPCVYLLLLYAPVHALSRVAPFLVGFSRRHHAVFAWVRTLLCCRLRIQLQANCLEISSWCAVA